MRSQVIMSGGPYKLVSYGNGTAYALENHCFAAVDSEPLSTFVQGDDAASFREELDAMEVARPDWATRDILGELWATYYQVQA